MKVVKSSVWGGKVSGWWMSCWEGERWMGSKVAGRAGAEE